MYTWACFGQQNVYRQTVGSIYRLGREGGREWGEIEREREKERERERERERDVEMYCLIKY